MSYLIHFNPNHDPKNGRFTFSKTAAKVAGIAAGNYSDKELSDKEAKEIASKYKNYKYLYDENGKHTEEYTKLRKKYDEENYGEFEKKRRFDEDIYDGLELLFWERADRIANFKSVWKMSDEEAEKAVKSIDTKIQNYLKTGEAFVNSPTVQKQLKELGLKTEDVWDSKKIYENEKAKGDRIYNLTVDYNKLYSEKRKSILNPNGSRIVFEPYSYSRRGTYNYKDHVAKLEKDYKDLQDPNSEMSKKLREEQIKANQRYIENGKRWAAWVAADPK